MNKEYLVELTKEIYKITLLFPKKEPLRYRMREIADGILEDFAALDIIKVKNAERYSGPAESMKRDMVFSLERGFESMDRYFEIAKWQRWLDYFDILSVQEKYAKIRENLLKEEVKTEMGQTLAFGFNFQKSEDVSIPSVSLSEKQSFEQKKEQKLDTRKEKILKVLEKVGRIQTGEINKMFPEVSKRTLRRDFHKLVETGIVERLGDKNNTFYKIKSHDLQEL